MSNSFFFLQADKNECNRAFIDQIEEYANQYKVQVYLIDRPLGDSKYQYEYKKSIVLLSPKHKILFVDFGDGGDDFDGYASDFTEDLGSISDKFRYKQIIGRPKSWSDLIANVNWVEGSVVKDIFNENKILSGDRQKVCELLISLLTGSINDIDRIKGGVPDNLLDKIKQKILLFDGEQTRFVYEPIIKNEIRIQGMSGTGKTELLLHKLKELYVGSDSSRIAFTCHNKILADNLRKRIPDFFNFMKVEQQIRWNERLWCIHAWGSQFDATSGIYRYICETYGLAFHRYSPTMNFDKACTLALQQINALESIEYAFDYILIDESQDFPESFFNLCKRVTKCAVFIAGDIFQNIFDDSLADSIEPDYLLSKCYRTDPRTLMFSHAIGMGLFEANKLRWLEDKEWKACGYIVEKDTTGKEYYLKREPLRRFEDLGDPEFDSVSLIETSDEADQGVEEKIISIIEEIRVNNPTVLADDIGIVFMDVGTSTYKTADRLEQTIPRKFGWMVNKAHESKRKLKDTVFVSNKNNVKGLEFPFVICVAGKISSSPNYRNALYMMLTRSFIKTYFLMSKINSTELLGAISTGIKSINRDGYVTVSLPSVEQRERIKTIIKYSDAKMSYYDFIYGIFDELNILPIFRDNLYETTKKIIGEDFDYENAKEVIEFNYKKMAGGRS